MGNTAGSISKVTLDGITFDAFASANFTKTGLKYENSMVPTSGKSFNKMLKRSQDVESVELKANPDEQELLQGLADRTDLYPMSYTTIDGSVFRAKGKIEYENNDTAENKASIKFLPEDGWEIFSA